MVDFEDIHPPRGAVVERPLQEPGAEQQVERPGDLHEIVPDVRSELLTAEDDARMPREEEEQVEVARVPQTGCFNQLHDQGVGRLNVPDVDSPSGSVNDRQGRDNPGRICNYSRPTGRYNGSTRWYRSCVQSSWSCSD